MIALLSEIGKGIAQRWLTALVLPGLLFAACLVCAVLLGQGHAVDASMLAAQMTARTAQLNQSPVRIALVVAAALLVATASAYVAQGVTVVVNAVWTADQPKPLVRWRRRHASERLSSQPKPYLPARITPIGDAWRLAGERVASQYSVDLTKMWPRLWLQIGADTRAVVQDAFASYTASLMITSWGLMYIVVGFRWWPAAVVGVFAVAIGYWRGVSAAAATADLIESVVDLHIVNLARAVDIQQPANVTKEVAVRLNDIFYKRQQF